MQILQTKGWDEYALLDSGSGYRLERFGNYIVSRPDPQAIWERHLSEREWQKADATFIKKDGKEQWILQNTIPERWLIRYKDISFYAKLTPFKHTGIFPEQSLNWDFITSVITKSNRVINVLNLFAYTGIASVVAAKAGAKVTHVDASRPSIAWAKENQAASGLSETSIRWILDDASKFVQREIKRGVRYDAIIMDPPVYGHGPDGEVWDFGKSFPELMSLCRQVLSDQPLFFVVNAYAISASALMLQNVLEDHLGDLSGKLEVGELALEETSRNRLLSTGIFARWSA